MSRIYTDFLLNQVEIDGIEVLTKLKNNPPILFHRLLNNSLHILINN